MFGFLNVNKPPGPTSHDLVAAVRRMLPRRTKVGHAGTLDPFAQGVLVLCVGPATRLASYVQAGEKRYRAAITLGATTTTDDSEGCPAPTPSAAAPSEMQVREAMGRFVGEIQQVPPAHSAVRVRGRRAYKLAREGEKLELPPRTVTIHAIELIEFAWPTLTLDVHCGSGTYIRALARDIGETVAVGGYCSGLVRTAVGPFTLADAVDPGRIDPASDLVPPVTALGAMPRLTIDESDACRISMGKSIRPQPEAHRSPSAFGSTDVALLDAAGSLLALARFDPSAGLLHPHTVFIAAG